MANEHEQCQDNVYDSIDQKVRYCQVHKGHSGVHISRGNLMHMWYNSPDGPVTPETHYKTHKA